MKKPKTVIKNCWRCNGKAKIMRSSEKDYFIYCTECDVESIGIGGKDARKEVINWWNQRA